MYYQAHALIMENEGELDQADALFMQGLRAGAQPLATLIEAYDGFKRRVTVRENYAVVCSLVSHVEYA